MPDGTWRAFRTGPNQPINPATDDLGAPADISCEAWAINGVGQVVGNAAAVGAFRTAPNSPINPQTDGLGTLGGTGSGAYAINSSGQVAGVSESISGGTRKHLFRTDPNQPINPLSDDLGTLGTDDPLVRGMNDRGDIVGTLLTSEGADIQRAFACLGSTILDLNDVIEAGSGWKLEHAYDINNMGQIVGSGHLNAEFRAYRLDPIPEPATWLTSIAGMIGFGFLRQWNRPA